MNKLFSKNIVYEERTLKKDNNLNERNNRIRFQRTPALDRSISSHSSKSSCRNKNDDSLRYIRQIKPFVLQQMYKFPNKLNNTCSVTNKSSKFMNKTNSTSSQIPIDQLSTAKVMKRSNQTFFTTPLQSKQNISPQFETKLKKSYHTKLEQNKLLRMENKQKEQLIKYLTARLQQKQNYETKCLDLKNEIEMYKMQIFSLKVKNSQFQQLYRSVQNQIQSLIEQRENITKMNEFLQQTLSKRQIQLQQTNNQLKSLYLKLDYIENKHNYLKNKQLHDKDIKIVCFQQKYQKALKEVNQLKKQKRHMAFITVDFQLSEDSQ